MNAGTRTSSTGRTPRLIRFLLISNFIVLLASVGPGSSHELYLKMRTLGFAHIIVGAVQFWVVAATVITTVLFIAMLFSKRGAPRRLTKLDWSLFLGWWIMVAMYCMYAFMMGTGG